MKSNGKIHILHLGSPTGLYGAERWILALIKHLDRSRVQSTVAVIKDDPSLSVDLCEHANNLGFPTQIFESYGRVSFSAIGNLHRFIKDQDIHILHSHWYKTDIIGWLAVQGTGCRILSTPHGWSTKGGIKVGFYEFMDRCAYPFFDAVAPLSEDLYKGLKWIPGLRSKLHLIENGVDIDEIDAVTEMSQELTDWKGNGCFILGYIGQLIPRKGIDMLVHAVAEMANPRIRLALVGDGIQRKFLEDLTAELKVSDQVRFFGFRKDRLSLLKGFDVFVLPSRLEGIPRCLMEAMAAGIPVMATDIPGSRELAIDNVTGLLARVDSSKSLAEGISRLFMEESLRKKLAAAGRKLILNRFSATTMAKQYLSLYHSLL